MNVLVLGAGGMAGHVVALYLRENGLDIDTLSAKKTLDKDTHLIDVTDSGKLQNFLASNKNKYDVVVNCIALLVKESEERKDLAVYLNAYLPCFLENYYKNSKTKVIHISTDAVFSGQNPPYQENSAYDGESFYGRTKALGEIINAKDLTLRLSIIGPSLQKDGTGLFHWFFNQSGEIQGFTNVIWSGVTTLELAKGIKAAIEQNFTGLYHFVPQEAISKFKLLQLLKETFNHKDIQIKPTRGSAVGTTLTSTRTDFDYQVPDYKTMAYDMKAWIESHPNLYQHYES